MLVIEYFSALNHVEKDVFCAQQSCIFVCKGCFRFMVYWLFLFLVAEGFWKCQKDEATQRRKSETTADRFSRKQWHNWNRRAERKSPETG